MAGRILLISSSAVMEMALGFDVCPPMSTMVAPDARWLIIVVFKVSIFVGLFMPPSEKESGVRFRTDII